jgi:hypothetical protein
MRRTVTVTLVVVGFALMVIGFFVTAPWGTSSVEDADPVFTGAPLVFVVGIIAVVAAAVLYELLPDRHGD